MINEKPKLDISQVQIFLDDKYGERIQELKLITNENYVNSIYSYKVGNVTYIIRFNKDRAGFDIHRLLYKNYGTQGIAMANVIDIGYFQEIYYCILEEIPGITLNEVTPEKFSVILPSFLETINKIHTVNIVDSKGYGAIDVSGNGISESWTNYVQSYFSNHIEGFWNNWHQLFDTSFLEKDIFETFYSKMLELCKYSEPHRHLIHGDCHFSNLITNYSAITGVIDWDVVKYGDFLFDIASLDMNKPYFKIPKMFKAYYDKTNIKVPNFEERFLCSAYFRGIDCLRFYAKLNDESSYRYIKKYLYGLSE